MVSHLRDYILAIWKVPSPSQPDTTKERLTSALLGISHNGTKENQKFTHVMLHRPNACIQQSSVQFFPGEYETTEGMPVKLSETNIQHFSELSFIFFTPRLKLPETSYTCEKGTHTIPTRLCGVFATVAASQTPTSPGEQDWVVFSGSGICYNLFPNNANRATKVVGCQNCCQRFCQHSNTIQENDFLADMATPTKHHSINCIKKSKNWSRSSSEKGKWREWWVLMG